MKIQTLADILAESDADSASHPKVTPKPSSKRAPKGASKKGDKPKSTDKRKHKHTTSSRNVTSYDDAADSEIDTASVLSKESLDTFNKKPSTSKKRKKRFHPAATFVAKTSEAPAYQPPKAQSIKEMLAEVKQNVYADNKDKADKHSHTLPSSATSDTSPPKSAALRSTTDHSETDEQADNLPAALKAYLRTPEQRQAEADAIKAESRLRWLAFYYLSRREYGKAELKQKLLDKEQDPEKIDALLEEFEEKGYQSDYRTTLMLIRENIRKGRGRSRIKQAFYQKKVAIPANIDELIDMANAEADEFSEFTEDSADSLVDGVDWLKLAVTARTKKYGNDIPTEQKDKARQLRFLQYRGFHSDVCFAALGHTLETLDERF